MTAKLAVSYFFTTWSGPSRACARVDRKTRVLSKENERRWGIPLLRAGS